MKIKLAAAMFALGLALSGQASAEVRMSAFHPAGGVAPAMTAPAADLDHQRIIALLTNLTNQVAALGQQVAATQDALKALQITVNLAMNNADKARVAAVNDGSATANVQAGVGGLATSIALMQANIASLQSRQTDMARRLYMTCYIAAISYVAPVNGLRPYDKSSCTSGGWSPGAFNFDTPFITTGVAPAVGGAPVKPSH